MPRTTIYLAQGLHERVQDSDLPLSKICQAALIAELDRIERGEVEPAQPNTRSENDQD